MFTFSTRDPFPLVSTLSEVELKAHSRAVDSWLGLNVNGVEKDLGKNGCRHPHLTCKIKQQLWIGLEPQDLLTPYIHLRNILSEIQPRPGETVVDLGAAYGRLAFVMARHSPETQFIGYEYVGERVDEFKRCGARHHLPMAKMNHQDLLAPHFRLPKAEFYFLYDFGETTAIETVLFQLKKMAHPFTLIARGRHSRACIDHSHSWLSCDSRGEQKHSVYKNISKWVPFPKTQELA